MKSKQTLVISLIATARAATTFDRFDNQLQSIQDPCNCENL